MKKVIIMVLFAMLLISGCKKHSENKPDVTASPSPSISASAAPAVTGENSDTGSTAIKRMDSVTEQTIDETNKEKDFSGVWRATGTTSENASFESMEVEIHYNSYSVSMNFSDSTLNTTVTGTYKIKNGVLIFDDNFKDCTAYFYNGGNDTLVVDNGSSLVFCEKRELEEEME